MIYYRFAEPTYERHVKNLSDTLTGKPEDMDTVFALSHHTRVFKVTNLPTHAKPILIHMMLYFVPQSVTFEVSEVIFL